jgi:uncharacterized membrane protein
MADSTDQHTDQHTDQSTDQSTDPAGQRGGHQGQVPQGRSEQVEPVHETHGQSVASWTAVIIIMLGSLVMAIAVVITTVWLFVVGAVIVVLGAVSGKVLSAMGFGASGGPGH